MRFRVLSLALTAVLCCSGETAEDYRAEAHDHYFNLEYDEALANYYRALKADGENAADWNHIATTILFSELHRLGKLETSAFRGNNSFLDEERPEPDPEANERFLGALHEGRRLAEAALAKDPDDPKALFSLSSGYALEANYLFMLEKSYFSALRTGTKARKTSERILEVEPEFVDAYLAPGVQEYVVGSLPWAVKMFAALGGVRGNKEKGQQWVQRVADEGDVLQTEAQMLLTILHRREGRPLEAAKGLDELIERFPRNYVLRLESASMYADAQEKTRALQIFKRVREMVRRDEHGYGRMPERLSKALDEKIKELTDEGSNSAD